MPARVVVRRALHAEEMPGGGQPPVHEEVDDRIVARRRLVVARGEVMG